MSIFSVASKILERVVYVQFESYLRENAILYGFQSGFTGSFSTDTCLTHLHNQTSCGNFTGMVLIDLQKAFDTVQLTVDHVILLKQLEAMGVSSVDWFRSYLSGRTHKLLILIRLILLHLISLAESHKAVSLGPSFFMLRE